MLEIFIFILGSLTNGSLIGGAVTSAAAVGEGSCVGRDSIIDVGYRFLGWVIIR